MSDWSCAWKFGSLINPGGVLSITLGAAVERVQEARISCEGVEKIKAWTLSPVGAFDDVQFIVNGVQFLPVCIGVIERTGVRKVDEVVEGNIFPRGIFRISRMG